MTSEERTGDVVRRKAERIHRAKRQRPTWRHLAHVGVLGWMFVLPLLALSYAGHYVAQRIDQLWPAVTGVGLGVVLGAYLAWRQLRRDLQDEDDDDA